MKLGVKLLLSSTLLLCYTASAQENLVVNGSFEDSTGCPQFGEFEYCNNWFSPNQNTPDYFYRNCCCVPQGGAWFQEPQDGDAYTMLAAKYATPEGREYITGKLKKNWPLALITAVNFMFRYWIHTDTVLINLEPTLIAIAYTLVEFIIYR